MYINLCIIFMFLKHYFYDIEQLKHYTIFEERMKRRLQMFSRIACSMEGSGWIGSQCMQANAEAGNKSDFQQQVSIPSIIFAPLIRYPIESISYLFAAQQVGGTRPGKIVYRFNLDSHRRVTFCLFGIDQELRDF